MGWWKGLSSNNKILVLGSLPLIIGLLLSIIKKSWIIYGFIITFCAELIIWACSTCNENGK